MTADKRDKPLKKPFFQRLAYEVLFALRLTSDPSVKLYQGYGNSSECHLHGHALSLGPMSRRRYRNNFLSNTLALFRLFIVKPIAGAELRLSFEGKVYKSISEKDGFFKFEWRPLKPLSPGCYNVEVSMVKKHTEEIIATGKAGVVVPHVNQYAFISDIDDTFLISHSGNLRKRLFVLLTENARSRKPFDGVVNHYNLLSMAGAIAKTNNAFFYVSSSEWNLYEYIREFSRRNKLPDGVYLLNQIKTFSQVFKTGQNNHKTKFMRIVRILEAFPKQVFILLGDDTQEDPNIYASVVSHFKSQIFCVYIRMVTESPKPAVVARLKEIDAASVKYCYFRHSAEAVIHSRSIGVISHV